MPKMIKKKKIIFIVIAAIVAVVVALVFLYGQKKHDKITEIDEIYVSGDEVQTLNNGHKLGTYNGQRVELWVE